MGANAAVSTMTMSIEELRALAVGLRGDGLNSQQIADELSLSQDTVAWLLAGEDRRSAPADVRIGWRTIGVKPERIEAIGAIMADVAYEEAGEGIDTVVGISINGIVFSQETAKLLDAEVVLSSGVTMTRTIEAIRAAGGEAVLAIVLVNKTMRNEIEGVPLRGIVRAVPV